MNQYINKFFDYSLDLFCIAGMDGYFKKINPAFTRVLGWCNDELLGRPFLEFVHPDDVENTRREIAHLRDGLPTISFENRYRCLSGKYKHLVWTSYPDLDSQLLFAVARDISDKKLAEQKMKDMVFSLNQRALQFTNFIDTGMEILKIDQDEALIPLALERATAMTNASRGLVQIQYDSGEQEQVFFPSDFALGPQDQQNSIQTSFQFLDQSYRFMVIEKESRSGPVQFESTDQLLLDLLAQQVKVAFENKYMLQERLDRERINRELELASIIQRTILPVSLPSIDGYEATGFNISSREVGGDFFEIIPCDEGRFALAIADVSGKGVHSALLVNSLHASLHAYLESRMSLPEMTMKLNKLIFDVTTPGMFITFFLAILKPQSGELECLNAGHTPPLLLRTDGRIENPIVGGLPLGCVRDNITFESEKYTMNPGEGLLLFTDGIPEAMNAKDELYEHSGRFEHFVDRLLTIELADMRDLLVEDIKDFCQSSSLDDDVTVLYLRRNCEV